jgi:hypothetical protein
MLRAAQRAREVARMYGTPLVIMENGKVVEIPPDEIEDLPKELLEIAVLKTAVRKVGQAAGVAEKRVKYGLKAKKK